MRRFLRACRIFSALPVRSVVPWPRAIPSQCRPAQSAQKLEPGPDGYAACELKKTLGELRE